MPKRKFSPKKGPYDEIIRLAENRVGVLPDVYYNELPQEMRRFAFTVSGIERISHLRAIFDSLEKAKKDGIGFNQWKETVDVQRFIDLADSRKRTVFQTHMANAYNRGIYELHRENPETFPYLRYQAILDDRTRPNHAANDGVVRRADDEYWETHLPPIGFNCRCIALNATREDLDDKPLTPKKEALAGDKLPDQGWRHNKLKPDEALTRFYRKRVKSFPKIIRDSLLTYLSTKLIDMETWWEKNKNLFDK